MLQPVQEFFRMDDATFSFVGWFIAIGVLLAAASAVHGMRRSSAPATAAASGGRPAAVSRAIAFGQAFVDVVARSGVTPNQITVIGLLLVVFNCGIFVWTANPFWFGSGLIASLLFDTLDGLVARAQGTSSHLGGYLDAIVDRYEEVLIYLVIGYVLEQWFVAFLIITGSMLISYNKARTALEIETSNKGWPDLLIKPVRLFILCVGLIGAPVLSWFLPVALWMLAAMTHFTALQRFTRAAFILSDADKRTAA